MIWRRCKWNSCAEKALAELIDPAVKSALLSEIEQGQSCLWCIEDGDFKTWLITHVEVYETGTELVLEAVQGRDVNSIIQSVKERCKSLGINSIRFETHHSEKVAGRLIRGSGFERAATIFRCQL